MPRTLFFTLTTNVQLHQCLFYILESIPINRRDPEKIKAHRHDAFSSWKVCILYLFPVFTLKPARSRPAQQQVYISRIFIRLFKSREKSFSGGRARLNVYVKKKLCAPPQVERTTAVYYVRPLDVRKRIRQRIGIVFPLVRFVIISRRYTQPRIV